jgi:hypothetical protein
MMNTLTISFNVERKIRRERKREKDNFKTNKKQ